MGKSNCGDRCAGTAVQQVDVTLSNDKGESQHEGTQLQVKDFKELLTIKQKKDSTFSGGSPREVVQEQHAKSVGWVPFCVPGQDMGAGLSLIYTLETGQILPKHPLLGRPQGTQT